MNVFAFALVFHITQTYSVWQAKSKIKIDAPYSLSLSVLRYNSGKEAFLQGKQTTPVWTENSYNNQCPEIPTFYIIIDVHKGHF